MAIENKNRTPNIGNTVLPYRLNGYYVIVGKKGNVNYYTLSYQRKTCIKKFLVGGIMTWKDCLQFGWKCLKVNVSFQPCH